MAPTHGGVQEAEDVSRGTTSALVDGAAGAHDDLEECLAEPDVPLDHKIFVWFAGCLAYRCRTMGIPAPDWCDVEPLPEPWFPFAAQKPFVDRALRESPPELARLNVFYCEISINNGTELADVLSRTE